MSEVVCTSQAVPPSIRMAADSKVARVEMAPGDSMRIETPGGGGYGLPAERDPAALAQDLRDARVSHAAAERDYGTALVAAALKHE